MTKVDLSRVYRAMLRKQQTLLATLGRTTPVHHGAAPLANLPDRTRGKTFWNKVHTVYRVFSKRLRPPVLHRNLAMESDELSMSGNDPVSSSSIGAFLRAPSNWKKADGEIWFLLDAPLRASVSKNEDWKKCIYFFNHSIDVILRRQDTRSSLGLFYFFL